VVLVRVGKHDGTDGAIAQVREIWQHEVDAEVLVARKRKARIDDDPLPGELEHGHVLSDLAEAAERHDA
jgi:hypothetical protein